MNFGESPREFQLRVHKAFDTMAAKILSRSLPENIALVTHAGVINILYYRLKGLEWNNKKPVFPSTCTGLHEVCYLEGNWKITVENDSTHLRTRKR
ncbi:histidine phosphatase family protein [Candidatus Chlorohelix allophototropha]|uniref:histidine phosphatase family protein n=1 Tax=Candidatus Chlorohelix allophototropha TaxID=3003348 RepID=UPI003CE54821